MSPTRAARALAVIVALALLAGPAAGQAPGRRGGTLIVVRQGEATNLDPHKVPAFTSHRVFELVYSTLTRLEQKGHVRAREGAPTAMRGGRRKKLYSVAAAGQSALRTSLSAIQALQAGLSTALGES